LRCYWPESDCTPANAVGRVRTDAAAVFGVVLSFSVRAGDSAGGANGTRHRRERRPGMAVSNWKEGEIDVLEFKDKLVCGGGDVELRNLFGELIDAGGSTFVLDLHEVPYIDSAVVGEIVSCAKRARQAGGELRLVVEAKGRVEDMLRLCSLDRVLDLYPDRKTALEKKAD